MLSRPATGSFVTTVKFTLKDTHRSLLNSAIISEALESLAPVIAYKTCVGIANQPRKISISFFRDFKMKASGCSISIEILTATNLSEQKEQLEPQIREAIEKGIALVNKDKIFVLETKIIELISTSNDKVGEKYKGKVSARKYENSYFGITELMAIEFLDEGHHTFHPQPISTKHSYSHGHISKVSGIIYEYVECKSPDATGVEMLTKEVEVYVNRDKKLHPILQAIKEADYNLAFRRSCFAGKIELVILLFKYHNEYSLNIDINEASSNGKTPLDYAMAADCPELVDMLRCNGAINSDSLMLTFADTEREEIKVLNSRSQSVISRNPHTFSSVIGRVPGYSETGLPSRGDPHRRDMEEKEKRQDGRHRKGF